MSRNKWHRPAVSVAWLVLIAFTTISSWLNVQYVILRGGGMRAMIIHGGLPPTLVVSLVLLELAILAGAHGPARWVGMVGLTAVSATSFAGSYHGILAVVVADDPSSPVALSWSTAAVPDTLMTVATAVLVSLRYRAAEAGAAGAQAGAQAGAAGATPVQHPVTSWTAADTTVSPDGKPVPVAAPAAGLPVQHPEQWGAPSLTSGDGDEVPVEPEHVARAEELVRQGVTVLPVPRVAQVLGMAQAGVSQRRIAATVPAHRKTVASIVGAAGGGDGDGDGDGEEVG